MVRMYLDGIEVTNPLEWEELSVTVKSDHKSQVTLIEYEESLTLIADGYDYLYSRVNAPCALIEVLVEMETDNGWDDIIKGVIFIGDVSFDELKCEARVQIQDDGYSARVQNNKNVNANLSADTTKNGEPITAAFAEHFMMFDPIDGIYYFPRMGFTVYECFKFTISWITDNRVGFQSNYFQTGAGAKTLILSGLDVRDGGVTLNAVRQAPQFKFADLYNVFRRLDNVGMGYKRDSDNNPVLVIEHISYFRGATVVLDLEDINQTELDFVRELLYAKVQVGSKITSPWECDNGNTRCTAGNTLLYFGFDLEEYAFTGECNKDVSLDLTLPDGYVIDTSTIEDVIIFGNESYDNDNFIVRWDYDPAPFKMAIKSDVIGNGKLWYNEYFTNKEVVARYQDYLFGAMYLYGLQVGVYLCHVTGTANPVFPLPTDPFHDDYTPQFDATVSDPFNTYSLNPANRYTALHDGDYKFKVEVRCEDDFGTVTPVVAGVRLRIDQFSQGGTLVFSHVLGADSLFVVTVPVVATIVRTSDWITLEANQYVQLVVEYWQDVDPSLGHCFLHFKGNYFQCVEAIAVIKDEIPTDGGSRRIIRTTTQSISVDWASMKNYLNDTTQRLRISNDRIDRTGWNDSVKHTFVSGKTDVSILNN